MKFPVLQETQTEQESIPKIEPGIYEFSVVQALEKISQAGNEMLKIKLFILPYYVYDHLVASKEATWKISQFCKSIGKEGLYNTGSMEPKDILYCKGKCEIVYNKEGYPSVKSYIIGGKIESSDQEELNDPLPF